MKKDFLKFVGIGLLAFQLVSHQTASAAIVDNGTYTTDTTSGLDWLDLTPTLGKSYFQVEALLGSGQLYAGWSFATHDQLDMLAFNYTGLSTASAINSSLNPNLFDGLIGMLGQTFTGNSSTVYGSMGLLSDIAFSSTHEVGSFERFNLSPIYGTSLQVANTGKSTIGSFLVRATTFSLPTEVTAVPEPQTYAMFLAGVMLLGFSVSRKKS